MARRWFLKRAALVFVVISMPMRAGATVDYCVINDLTEECALVESGGLFDFYQPLGWTPCDCGERCPPVEEHCRELGYAYRGDHPSYKIEAILSVLLLAGLSFVVVARRRRRARSAGPEGRR